MGREVSTFQSALCHEVNTALILLPTEPDTLPTKEQVQQKALQTVIAFFNNQQPDPEHEVGALHNFLSSRYIVAVESQRLKQILSQPQSPCREPQELLKLLTQIHGHLHTMQFGVEWVKDQENAATLHSYFTLIETSKGVYRASINSIARSPAITT